MADSGASDSRIRQVRVFRSHSAGIHGLFEYTLLLLFFGGFSISLRPQTITPAATDDFIFFLWWTAETGIAGTNTRLEVYLNGSLVCSWNRTALLPGVQNVWIQLACPDPFTLYANQPTEFMLRMFKVRLQHSHSLLVKYSIRIRHLPRTFGLRC